MTNYAQGIDVSSHNPVLNGPAIKAAGVSFIEVKATEGTTYINPHFFDQSGMALKMAIIWGAYHFFRWDADPVEQARHFLAATERARGDLPLALDVEKPGDGAGFQTYGVHEAQRRVRLFVDTIRTATGETPILYTYPDAWQQTMGNSDAFGDCPLWIASYGKPTPTLLPGWNTWTFWQYTDKQNVPGAGLVDADRYNGTVDDLKAWVGVFASVYTDPLTGHTIGGGFLNEWKASGGVAANGRPLTGEESGDNAPWSALPELRGYRVQLFERAAYAWKAGEQVTRVRVGALVEAMAKGK